MEIPQKLGPKMHRSSCRKAIAGLFAATLAAVAGPAAAHSPSHDTPPPRVIQDAGAVTPPDAAAVLQSIYQIDGQGADSYEVANGAIARSTCPRPPTP